MQIQADLIYDQRTENLVGFVLNQESDCFDEEDADLATHVLVFYVVGINSKLSMSLGFFPTKNAHASFIYPKFWKAVEMLELRCGLKVSSSV